MKYGIKTRLDNGVTQFDSEKLKKCYQLHTVRYGSNELVGHTVNVDSISAPLLLVRNGLGFIESTTKTGSRYTSITISVYPYLAGNGDTVDWAIFTAGDRKNSSGYGIRAYTESGEITFSSTKAVLKPVDEIVVADKFSANMATSNTSGPVFSVAPQRTEAGYARRRISASGMQYYACDIRLKQAIMSSGLWCCVNTLGQNLSNSNVLGNLDVASIGLRPQRYYFYIRLAIGTFENRLVLQPSYENSHYHYNHGESIVFSKDDLRAGAVGWYFKYAVYGKIMICDF